VSDLTLYIIRHAEKPDEDWPGHGFTIDGQEDKESLVIRGWQRAGAWAAFFGKSVTHQNALSPQQVFAATPGAPDHLNHGPSRRPAETATPLAQQLKLGLDTTYGKGQEAELVAALLKLSGSILVCWEHKAIVEDILPKLPITGPVPTKWPGDRFDLVLRLNRPDGADSFSLTQMFPMLLSGDSDKPI